MRGHAIRDYRFRIGVIVRSRNGGRLELRKKEGAPIGRVRMRDRMLRMINVENNGVARIIGVVMRDILMKRANRGIVEIRGETARIIRVMWLIHRGLRRTLLMVGVMSEKEMDRLGTMPVIKITRTT
jgi:hypothetical protein